MGVKLNSLITTAALIGASGLEQSVQAQPSFPLDGLSRYYAFDEGQGILANDLTGNHTMIVADSWTPQGKLSSAYFPNGNSYNTGFNPFNQRGVSANFWLKKVADWPKYESIIGTGGGNGTFIIGTATNPNLYFGLNEISPEFSFPNDGNYHMVTLSIEDGNEKLYLDGAQEFSFSLPFSAADKAVRIFGGLGGNSVNQDMHFDELGIWNRAINSREISALYNNGKGLACPLPEPSVIGLGSISMGILAQRRRRNSSK